MVLIVNMQIYSTRTYVVGRRYEQVENKVKGIPEFMIGVFFLNFTHSPPPPVNSWPSLGFHLYYFYFPSLRFHKLHKTLKNYISKLQKCKMYIVIIF